ncbi:MAG: hypothetical protein HY786_04940 [Deltaproteobacteria bacterium]|nr:hypothetical protein [Deltaproteobacteria bacterium]
MSEDKEREVKGEGVDFSKRAFIKTALIGGIAVASGAVIAKKIVSNIPNTGLANASVSDELQQDRVMKDKEFVVMSKEEKDRMVQMFVSGYKYTA